MRLRMVLASVGFLSSSAAFGWGDIGHQLVGAIAEETMSAPTKDFVRGILGIEPLAIAATFPDHVKSDKRFATKPVPGQPDSGVHDFAPYHFSEMPVGEGLDHSKKRIEKDSFGIIKYSKDVLKDPKVSREQKAIILRYLIHVVGDIHQPLHVGNGFDRGGNGCQVVWKNKDTDTPVSTNLHAWWDSTIIDYIAQSFADPVNKVYAPRFYSEFLIAFKKKHPTMFTAEAKARHGSGAIIDWYTESQGLRETMYPDDKAAMAKAKYGEEYKHRPYCVWWVNQDHDASPAPGSKVDPTKIPVLNADYAKRFQPMTEEQILKAGLRLATLLDQVAAEVSGDPRFPRITDAQETSLLKEIHQMLKNVF